MKLLLTVFIMLGAWFPLYSFGEENKGTETTVELTEEEEKQYNFCLAGGVLSMYSNINNCISIASMDHQHSGNTEAFSVTDHGAECLKTLAKMYFETIEWCKERQTTAKTMEPEASETPVASAE